jgi:hypothetical protein
VRFEPQEKKDTKRENVHTSEQLEKNEGDTNTPHKKKMEKLHRINLKYIE